MRIDVGFWETQTKIDVGFGELQTITAGEIKAKVFTGVGGVTTQMDLPSIDLVNALAVKLEVVTEEIPAPITLYSDSNSVVDSWWFHAADASFDIYEVFAGVTTTIQPSMVTSVTVDTMTIWENGETIVLPVLSWTLTVITEEVIK